MLPPNDEMNKYGHLLQVIEEMGRDIKPTYANNKNAAERLKKNIHTARILVRECVSELERVMKSWMLWLAPFVKYTPLFLFLRDFKSPLYHF